MNALKHGMEMSKFEGRKDTMKLIEALEGLEMKLSDDFPQGDKTLRKADHQAFLNEFLYEVKGGKYKILDMVAEGQDASSRRPASSPQRKCARNRRSTIAPRRSGRGAASAPVLKTELLTVRFGGLAALTQVNFEVRRDEVRAIIGPNGAGKSTFFNCLTGVLRPTSGRIVFNGEDITGLPSNMISQKGIARSYQITNILPNATRAGKRAHRRAVAPPRLEHGRRTTAPSPIINEKAEAALASVGLLDKADELASNLSHGEQRNLEIGIALATEPSLLCLDEPTAGMSAAETHDTMQLVRRIAKDLTILIVEHDMQVVMELCRPHHRAALRRNSRRRHAGGNPAESQGAGGLSQDMSASGHQHARRSSWSRTCTPITARATSCTASRSQVGPGEVVGLLGRNGVGKIDDAENHHGPGAAEPRHGAARRQRHHRPAGAQAGAPRHRLRAGGPPHLPPAHGDGEPAHRPRPPRRHRGDESRRCSTRSSPSFPVLAERRNQAGGTLSGGEQQMLAIARAMMLEPKIILLDEPTEGLMPRMVSQIRQIIDVLHSDGVAILLVEQNVPLTLECEPARLHHGEGRRAPPLRRVRDQRRTTPVIKQYLGV